MRNKNAGILLFSSLLVAFCAHSSSSNQEEQKSPPALTQFGAPPVPAKQMQIPPGSHQPDRLFHPGAASTVTSLAFSPDGGWLASGGYDNSIIIWNAATGAEQIRLTWPRPPNDPLAKLEFSPDGNRLASYTDNGEVKIWDYRNGHNVYSLHLRGLSFFTYSPDGKVWAASTVGPKEGPTTRIEIHDAATGKPLRAIPTKWYGVTGMTITKEGLLVAAGTTIEDSGDGDDPMGTVQVWNVASGELAKSLPEFAAVGPVSPDGQFMAGISSEKGVARIIVTDLSNSEVKWTFEQQDAEFVSFSPDSKEIAVTTRGSAPGLHLWSLVSGTAVSNVREVLDPSQPVELTIAAFSPDGRWIAAPDSPAYSVKVWDVAAGSEVRTFCGQRSVLAVAISPDGRWLASAAAGVAILDPATGKIITTLTTDSADKVVFSPDGRWLAANAGPRAGAGLKVWDTKTWTVVTSVTPERDTRQNGPPVRWVAFGGAQIRQGGLGEERALEFIVDGETHTVWFGVTPLAVSPDGSLLVQLGMPMNNVEVWDTNSGQKLLTFGAHKMSTNFLAFSRDGRRLLTVGQESQRRPLDLQTYTGTTEFSAKLWDVATWKEGESVSFPSIRQGMVVFLPEGRGLAVQTSSEVIELQDMDHRTSLGTLAVTDPQPGYYPAFNGGNLAVSSDGTLLFQGAKNGIRVWNLPLP
jgi:WD40 repeat protein